MRKRELRGLTIESTRTLGSAVCMRSSCNREVTERWIQVIVWRRYKVSHIRLQSPPITPLNIRGGYKFKHKHW